MPRATTAQAAPDYVAMSWTVIDLIMEGDETIADLCKTVGMTQGAFYRTCGRDEQLTEALKVSRRIRAQRYADEALQLSKPAKSESGKNLDWGRDDYGRYTANTGLISRDSLRIKTLLTLAAKYDPEQFGDRVIEDVRASGKAMLVIGDTQKAAALIAEARKARLASPTTTEKAANEQATPTAGGPKPP